MSTAQIEHKGRIKRISPNINSKTGLRTDTIPYPYEDYCMAVDLSVRITDRYSCGFPNKTGRVRELNFSSNNGTMAFIGGSKQAGTKNDNKNINYLTTNFTDVVNTEPTSNTVECFGIESIDITYNSWLYPEVTIRFVDVRGASVMQPLEYEYYDTNNNKASMNKALYRALFTFPFPMFTLKVKGFYGKGATYQLACTQTDLEFDSSTGNFIITARFVGFMFGIYSELPMTYVASAPYSEAGKKYWKKGIEEGRFVFKDSSGNYISDMITIPEMRLKMSQAAEAQPTIPASTSVALGDATTTTTTAVAGGGLKPGVTCKVGYYSYKGPTNYGYPHVVVYKEDNMLAVYDASGKELFAADCTTGKAHGNKKRQGDNKTPEGEFKITSVENSTQKQYTYDDMGSKKKTVYAYGPWFHRLRVEYGNEVNTTVGIHGSSDVRTAYFYNDGNPLKPFKGGIPLYDSAGCVRLSNPNIQKFTEITKQFNGGKIAVVILPGSKDLTEDGVTDRTVISYKSVKDGTANFGSSNLVLGKRIDMSSDGHAVDRGFIQKEKKEVETKVCPIKEYNEIYETIRGAFKGLKFLVFPNNIRVIVSLVSDAHLKTQVTKAHENIKKALKYVDKSYHGLVKGINPENITNITDCFLSEVFNSFTCSVEKLSHNSISEELYNDLKVVINGRGTKFTAIVSTMNNTDFNVFLHKIKRETPPTSGNTTTTAAYAGGSGGGGGSYGVSTASMSTVQHYKMLDELSLMNALGFLPSIRNIFELVFAHIETFMATFYERNENILGLLESKDSKRQITSYQTNINNTDLDPQNPYMPPYTGFYAERSLDNSSGVTAAVGQATVMAMEWPPRISEDANSLDEIQFILDLLNGAKTYSDESQEIDRMIENGTLNGTASKNGNPSTDVYKFIPLTPYDFITKGSANNPYEILKGKEDVTSFTQALWTIVLLRAIYVVSFSDANMFEKDGRDKWGEIDSVNFFKVFRDNLTSAAKEFLKKLETDEYNTEINDILSGTGLFNNLTYILDDEKGKNYFPVGEFNINTIKENNETSNFNNKYLVTVPDSGGTLYKGNGISVMNGGTYLTEIVDNLKSEWEAASSDIKEFGNRHGNEYAPENWENISKVYKNTYKFEFDLDTKLKDIYNCDIFGHRFTKSGDSITYSIDSSSTIGDATFLAEDICKDENEIFCGICAYSDRSEGGDKLKNFSTFELYKQQTNILAKAYLFIHGLPINTYPIKSLIESSKGNFSGPIPKSLFLYIGANEWWKTRREDEFNSNGVKNIPPNDKDFGRFHNILLINDPNPNFSTSLTFQNYVLSLGAKNYFINWAKNEFNTIEKYVANPLTYDDKLVVKFNPKIFKETKDKDVGDIKAFVDFSKALVTDLVSVLSPYYKEKGKEDGIIVEGDNADKEVKKFFKGFIYGLKQIYKFSGDEKAASEAEAIIEQKEAQNPFKSDDVRLSTYMSLKTLYDKWLCGPRDNWDEVWKLGANNSDFNNFIYVDSYYHDIGYKISVNLSKINAWFSSCIPTSDITTVEGAYNYTGKTVFDFLTTVAEDTGGLLMAMPHRFGEYSDMTLGKMFTPLAFNDGWDDMTTSFVFMYKYKPSEHLGDINAPSKLDMNGWSPKGDGLDFDDPLTDTLFGDNGYDVPAFSVAFAQQNQSLFKNIRLKGENNGATEAGLQATFQVAAKGSENPRESAFYGQDLYKVYSNYSYSCGIECMGNMQITPLMYFHLDNIPMWKGAYMISKVTHQIKAGEITTNFEGYRVNKYAVPFSEAPTIITKDLGLSALGSAGGGSVATGNVGYGGSLDGTIKFSDNPVNLDIDSMDKIPAISCNQLGEYQINGVSAKSIINPKFRDRLLFKPVRKVSSDRICYYFIRCLWVFSIIKEEYKNMTFSDGNKEYTNNTCYVSDSYRVPDANYGAKDSAHKVGAAIDINAGNNNVKAAEEALFICVVNTLVKYRIKWDQLLYETREGGSKWTHLGLYYDGDLQRQRIQRFHNDTARTVNQYNEFKTLFPIEKCPHLWVDKNTLKPNIGLQCPPSGVQLW